jgi:predicted nucleic acid-binding protein
MPNIVISDTSCLIVLEKIGELSLLQKIYQEVITTPEIATEYNRELPSWIKIASAKNKSIQRELEKKIDLGEASAIALGLEISNCSIILDDLKACKVAEGLKLEFTGTLGITVKAIEFNSFCKANSPKNKGGRAEIFGFFGKRYFQTS